jgi:hypothetical protein
VALIKTFDYIYSNTERSLLRGNAFHYEPKVAAWICDKGHRHLTAIINQDHVCPKQGSEEQGCQVLVPKMLLTGSTLTVWPAGASASVRLPGHRPPP